MDHVGTAGLIESTIKRYLQTLQENRVDVWRLYLFGSHARGTAGTDSDIDLAVFVDKDEIDDVDEDLKLMRLTRGVDLRIEPRSFSRKDFENPDPFVREIIATGHRII